MSNKVERKIKKEEANKNNKGERKVDWESSNMLNVISFEFKFT